MLKLLQKYNFGFKFVIISIFVFSFIFQYLAIINDNMIQFDEPYSLFISIPTESRFNDFYKHRKSQGDIDFDYVYRTFYIPNKSNIISDLKIIRIQRYDKPHPSLYYSLLRIWNINTDMMDAKSLLQKARFLNLVFLVMSFFLLYKLLTLLYDKDKKSIAIGLCFTFFSSGMVFLYGMAREYALQNMLLIAFTLCICRIFKTINSKNQLNYKEILVFGIVSGLFMLSGYFSNFYIAMCAAPLLCYSLIKKNYKIIFQILISFILSLEIVFMLCPNYFLLRGNFIADKCVNLVKESSVFSIHEIKSTFKSICFNLEKYSYYSSIFCLGVFCFLVNLIKKFKNKDINFDYNKSSLILILLAIAFIWSFLVLSLSPFRIPYIIARYMLPAIPILSLLFVTFFKDLKSAILIPIICLYFGLSIYQVFSKSYCDTDKLVKPELQYNEPLPIFTNGFSWECILLFYLYAENIKSVTFKVKDINDITKMHNNYLIFSPHEYSTQKPILNIGRKNLYFFGKGK